MEYLLHLFLLSETTGPTRARECTYTHTHTSIHIYPHGHAEKLFLSIFSCFAILPCHNSFLFFAENSITMNSEQVGGEIERLKKG